MYHISTTPFGRRPVTAGLLASQIQAQATPALPAADKYAVLDDLGCARAHFGLSDRDIGVLHALISFHPGKDIAGDVPTVVFPSNRSLADRAHGMAESTLRRHLAALVDAGLVLRCDSPNGKRYAAKDRSGQIVRAFGFDLRPLAARAAEIDALAEDARTRAHDLRRLREDVVLMLRDTCKLITYAITADLPGDWEELDTQANSLRKALRRKLDGETLRGMKAEATALLSTVHHRIDPASCDQNTEELSGSDTRIERHHQDSNTDISEVKTSKPEPKNTASEPAMKQSKDAQRNATPVCTIPLNLVLKACPDIEPYTAEPIRHWHQLVATARHLHAMMGISRNVWKEAQRVMGRDVAAVTCVAILQRVADIRNPSAYLRALTNQSARLGFSPGPMIMALLGGQGTGARVTS